MGKKDCVNKKKKEELKRMGNIEKGKIGSWLQALYMTESDWS